MNTNIIALAIILMILMTLILILTINITANRLKIYITKCINKKMNDTTSRMNKVIKNTLHDCLDMQNADIDEAMIVNLIEKYVKETNNLKTSEPGIFAKEDLINLCETFITDLKTLI